MKAKVMLSLILLFVFASCEQKNENSNLTPKQINLTAYAPEVIAGSNEFGIELFTKVSAEEEDNLMLSPLSASAALTMLLNGCGGDTYTQLKETLNYPENLEIVDINEAYKSLVEQLLNVDPKVKIAIANAIFYRLGFDVKPTFLETMESDFGAHVEGLDFSTLAALNTINQWASDNTNGKIPKVLDEIAAETIMFIMNALYFKGVWSYKFDESNTSSRAFFLDDGNMVNVPTMRGNVIAKGYYTNSFSTIELPYGQTNYNMVIIVPQGTLNGFTQSFTFETWKEITTYLDELPEGDEIEVYLPKFKFSYEKILNDQLKSMGMVDAFVPFVANLSGISDASIYVSFVKQNTFVEVNEEGTEAAAVTTIAIDYSSAGPQEFFANKPFIFAIRERTSNTLLFIGKVVNPS